MPDALENLAQRPASNPTSDANDPPHPLPCARNPTASGKCGACQRQRRIDLRYTACNGDAAGRFIFPNPMRKYVKHLVLITAGLMTGVLATHQFSAVAATQPDNTATPLPLDQLRTLAEVFGQIKHDYVEPVDDKKLLTAAIKGMVSSLDPHSSRRITRICRSRHVAALRVSVSKSARKTA
jgi:hypothetical protein